MLYTIFGILLLSPLALLVGSLSRTAVQVSRGDATGDAPTTVTQRSAKLDASTPSPLPQIRVSPALSGATRTPAAEVADAQVDNVVSLPFGRFARTESPTLSRTA